MTPHDHHAPAVARPPERAPFAASAAFWTGMLGMYAVLIPRLGPIGFLLGILTLLLQPLALLQGRRRDRSAKLAVVGTACALVAISIWLIAREDWPHVIGGDDNWPSWIMPDQPDTGGEGGGAGGGQGEGGGGDDGDDGDTGEDRGVEGNTDTGADESEGDGTNTGADNQGEG